MPAGKRSESAIFGRILSNSSKRPAFPKTGRVRQVSFDSEVPFSPGAKAGNCRSLTKNLSYMRGRTIPCCDWYFPFLSL